MIASADPRPLDPDVAFSVDPAAEHGNVLPALAMLLIGIDRQRRERAAAEGDEQASDHQHDAQGREGRNDA
jgi:hypothetical protein